ncbi:hypothetical protein PVL29_008179 [Vitis rotundifolia]|uniref:Uncharacterized protein n=1 Tax=Vitis rotundifolia TaxID=103349 RepID=A0AA39A1Z3_VITRO|nr:hypothetical protein PVL29_008179 [Vitis rotundifolia]
MLHGCPVAAVISLYFSDLLGQVAISNLESTNFPQLFEQFCHILIILGKSRIIPSEQRKATSLGWLTRLTHERDVISEVVGALFQTLFPGDTVYEESAGEVIDGYGWDL